MQVHALQVYYTVAVWVLCASGLDSQRVYFECGAKVDTVDAQGLILSPGFPNNYSSGTHCVWQFFIPVGQRLTMEMFDFDVYESSDSSGRNSVEDAEGSERTAIKGQEMIQEQQVVVQEDSDKMETANSIFRSSSRDQTNDPLPSGTEDETQNPQAVMDACPHDVLYITDLITFSSRFCGSKRPPRSQLAFGSDSEMTEVVMELITNTHWGRGFALIFRYSNKTQIAPQVGGQRSSAPADSTVPALLAAVSVAALFGVGFVVVLCMILRNKLCAKGSNTTSSIISEVPVQIPHADGSELQLVVSNHPEPELDKNDNHTSPHTGSSVGDVFEVSQNAELECFNGLLEMELGTDEVFMISNTTTPGFTPRTQREHFLRRCDTGPVQPSDWMPHSEPPVWPNRPSHAGSARPRAWSVRTFHDFLLPLPQLHRKWCSWNLTSPFTKLVDTSASPGPAVDGSDAKILCNSSTSLAQSHSAQRQRRFNPLRFNPSLTESQQFSDPDGAPCGREGGPNVCDYSAGDGNVSVPVFAISEEDDREPLVSSEAQSRAPVGDGINSVLGSAHLGITEEEESKSGVLKNTSSKILLPSLSHVTAPCDSVGKDM